MLRRMLGWARTLCKLVLVVLSYFWIGAVYKFVYAQCHDVRRFESRLPVPYYQQQFLVDSLIQQTWILGPDFRSYIGELPALGALMNQNLQSTLAAYCRRREADLLKLHERYPNSLMAEQALEDAYLYSQGAAFLGISGATEKPLLSLATRHPSLGWRVAGLPDAERPARVARQLADLFPDSRRAPLALLREGEAAAQAGRQGRSLEIYRRVVHEYPRSAEAEQAADAIVRASRDDGDYEEARHYRRLGLAAAEISQREANPNRPPGESATLLIAGIRLDLGGLEAQLREFGRAAELSRLATEELGRIRSTARLDETLKRDLRDRRERLDQLRSQLWVADMFGALGVEAPGAPPQAGTRRVRGRVTVEGRPFPGAEVILGDRAQGPRPGPRALVRAARSRMLRVVTDRKGHFEFPEVTSGRYAVTIVFPTLTPLREGGRPVPLLPAPGEGGRPAPSRPVPADFPEFVVVDREPVDLPPLNFRRAILPLNYGEMDLVGDQLRLGWEPWPGARRYRVEVLAAPGMSRLFDRKVRREERDEWRNHPVLWSGEVKGNQADVPLTALTTNEARAMLVAQYEYVVRALDGERELAESSPPLGRFFLSSRARLTALEKSGGRQRRNAPPTRRRTAT